MSGLTDRQFEIVCDLAERATTTDVDGITYTDRREMPKLLEVLLAAARKAMAIDPIIFADHELRWKTREEIEADAQRQWQEAMKIMEKTPENAEAEERVRERNVREAKRIVKERAHIDSFIPKVGDVCAVDGEKVKITHVHTNKIDGQWPSGAWPEVTIVGMRTEYPEGETTGGES